MAKSPRIVPGGAFVHPLAHHLPNDCNSLAALQDHCQRWTGRQESQERFVKRFALVHRVVPLCQGSIRQDQPKSRQAEPFAFETLQDRAGEAAMQAVRLKENECLLHVVPIGQGRRDRRLCGPDAAILLTERESADASNSSPAGNLRSIRKKWE